MDLLRAGDQLSAGANDAAELVFLDSGSRERLKAKSKGKVSDKGVTPATAVEKLEKSKLSKEQLTTLSELARSARGGVGVLRGEPPAMPLLVTPMFGTTVLGERPALSWPAAAKAESYQVEFLSGAGSLLWKMMTKEPRLPFPEKQPALKPGKSYTWRVTAVLGEDKKERIVDSKFAVATTEEVEELNGVQPLAKSKDPGDWLLAAVVYEAHGVYDEALKLYEKLAEQSPKEANYQATLANYYERAGRMDRAKEARERAKKLGAVVPEK